MYKLICGMFDLVGVVRMVRLVEAIVWEVFPQVYVDGKPLI